MVKPYWNMEITFDSTAAKEVLGVEFTDLKKSAIEMTETLIETGYVVDNRKK